MKRKKLFALGLVLLLTFTFVAPTFAASETFSFSQGAYRYFNKGYATKTDSTHYWISFRCVIDSISYDFNNYTYCYARPISNTGIYLSGAYIPQIDPVCYPNPSANVYNSAGFRIYNADYYENVITDNYMTIAGDCKIIYS